MKWIWFLFLVNANNCLRLPSVLDRTCVMMKLIMSGAWKIERELVEWAFVSQMPVSMKWTIWCWIFGFFWCYANWWSCITLLLNQRHETMFSLFLLPHYVFPGLRFADVVSPVRRQRTFHTYYLVGEFCSVAVPDACKAPVPAPTTPVFAVGATAAVVVVVIVIVAAPVAGYIQMILSLALC